jgi:hypothetical protein
MVFACLMPPMSPEPSTCVWHGGMAFKLSTMGRSSLDTLNEARRIAANIAKLPHLLGKGD